MSEQSRDDRLLELARRLLDGKAIDWANEDVAEAEVREGMKRLERIIGRRGDTTVTRHGSESGAAVVSIPATLAPNGVDRFIGGFRLVRKLGEGGMGVVYEAEQNHPRRRVALKVIRGGALVSPDTLKLFRREIQTLARLSHSGIAQLYETGVTDDGMHFFAMELVRGEPLSDWLRSRPKGPITPAELKIRLDVFRKICDAVAYAHQKGVIHRDLKPGNILIPKPVEGASIQDAVPEVKVLDFGVARITDSDVQATTFITEMGKVQGTLPYMSPEQVRGNPDEIDLRTDVYALGVILYEMIAGRLPYDISKAHLHEAVRIICEAPPRSLTTTFSGTRRLDADVATIATKCLEKEASRRYQSAAVLGEDIQHYLSDQPILARPPSTAYQFRKLILRHKGPFAAAAGAFALLAVFSVAMTFQAMRIAKERDRANQEAETAQRVSGFMESLFEVSNPFASREHEISAREILDDGAARIDTELANQPAIQMRLMRTIGTVYDWGLGLPDKAEPLLKRSLELAERLYGPESLEAADALNALGGFGKGLEYHERALAIRSRLLASDDARMIRSLYLLGAAQVQRNGVEAGATLSRALELVERQRQPDLQLHLWILNDLAIFRSEQEHDQTKALPLYRKALEIRERIYPEGHADRINGVMNVGYCLLESGEWQQARRYLEPALVSAEKALGAEHPLVGMAAANLGELDRREGKFDNARTLLERAVAIHEQQLTRVGSIAALSNAKDYVEALQSLGRVDEAQGRFSDSLAHLGHARELYLRGVGLKDASADYARVLRIVGRLDEAERIETSLQFDAHRSEIRTERAGNK